jgi:hypothetical protein
MNQTAPLAEVYVASDRLLYRNIRSAGVLGRPPGPDEPDVRVGGRRCCCHRIRGVSGTAATLPASAIGPEQRRGDLLIEKECSEFSGLPGYVSYLGGPGWRWEGTFSFSPFH